MDEGCFCSRTALPRASPSKCCCSLGPEQLMLATGDDSQSGGTLLYALALAGPNEWYLPRDIALTPDGESLAFADNGNQRVKVRLSALHYPAPPGRLHRCRAF